MADEGGVWRTIQGRRVFIKDGQSVTDAMKSSGKFKGKKGSKLYDNLSEYSAYQRDPYTGRKKTVVKNGVAVKDYWYINGQGNREHVKKGTRIGKDGHPMR